MQKLCNRFSKMLARLQNYRPHQRDLKLINTAATRQKNFSSGNRAVRPKKGNVSMALIWSGNCVVHDRPKLFYILVLKNFYPTCIMNAKV